MNVERQIIEFGRGNIERRHAGFGTAVANDQARSGQAVAS